MKFETLQTIINLINENDLVIDDENQAINAIDLAIKLIDNCIDVVDDNEYKHDLKSAIKIIENVQFTD